MPFLPDDAPSPSQANCFVFFGGIVAQKDEAGIAMGVWPSVCQLITALGAVHGQMALALT
jgi:hypothetical protein